MTAQQQNQTDRNELQPLNMILTEGTGGNVLMRVHVCPHASGHGCTYALTHLGMDVQLPHEASRAQSLST